jgi:hypothetical protein
MYEGRIIGIVERDTASVEQIGHMMSGDSLTGDSLTGAS